MSVISDVFTDFHSLIKTPRNDDETFKTFGSIFDAQFSKLKALGNNAKLSEPISSILLISNAIIEHSQRVSILATTAKGTEVKKINAKSKADEYMKLITYV